ncbi:disease resistance-like protein DSC1, partial [Neltuma alba]|uniref:disease resistance-like protein DSC1 n=1 Tax=Neltuma alba TaxID=207710 RepID=UPI0010A54A8C
YDEGEFIEGIAEDAYARLPPKRFHNDDYIVGLEPRIEEVMSLLNESDNSVSMLGIHGAGGIGKTTLAKAIYNSIFFYFEGACFLFDVREVSKKYQGVVRLQQTLLSEVLEEKKMKFGSVDEGISKIKHRLSHKKILLILDDVEEVEQLEQLAGGADWFGCGSKIIITTRNKQLLVAHDLKKTYEMKQLNEHDSLKLFCWHAFRMSHPPKATKENLEYVEDILGACYYGTRFYIEVLVDKSLITVADNGRLHMHDLIQQMAREIVKQEAPSSLGKRSRLWYYKDVLNGGNDIEGIILDPPKQEEVIWNGLAFQKMKNLQILIVRNTQFLTSPKYLPNSLILLDWERYPSMTLPPDFSPPKLVCFKLYRSLFKLEEPFQKYEYVTYMNFSQCEFLREVPDMSHFRNLKTLSFRECCNLIKVHDSVGSLHKLILLDVGECTKLKSFPCEINMPCLEDLTLSGCKSLNYLPRIVGKMDALTGISADRTAIKELPPSIGNLSGLDTLFIHSCKSLRELPTSLLMLQNLSTLCWEAFNLVVENL